MDFLFVAVMLASTLPFFALIVASNRRAWGRWTSPPAPDAPGWVIALVLGGGWPASFALSVVVLAIAAQMLGVPSESPLFGYGVAAAVGAAFMLPITAYQVVLARRYQASRAS